MARQEYRRVSRNRRPRTTEVAEVRAAAAGVEAAGGGRSEELTAAVDRLVQLLGAAADVAAGAAAGRAGGSRLGRLLEILDGVVEPAGDGRGARDGRR